MTVIFPPEVSVLRDLAKGARRKILSEDFEIALLPAIAHGLVGGHPRCITGGLAMGKLDNSP